MLTSHVMRHRPLFASLLVALVLPACGDDGRPPTQEDDAGLRDSGVRDADVVTDGDTDAGDAEVVLPWEGECAPVMAPRLLGSIPASGPRGIAVVPGYGRSTGAVDVVWLEGIRGAEEIRRQSFASTTGISLGDDILISRPINAMDPVFNTFGVSQGTTAGMLVTTGVVAGAVVPLAQPLKADGSITDVFASVMPTGGAVGRRVVTARLAAGGFSVAWLEAPSSVEPSKTIAVVHLNDAGEIDFGPERIVETNNIRSITFARDGNGSALVWTVSNDAGDAVDLKLRPIATTGTLLSAASTHVVVTNRQILDVSALRLPTEATSVGANALAWSEVRYMGARTDIVVRRVDDDGDMFSEHVLPGGEGSNPTLAFYDTASFGLVYLNPNFRAPSIRFRRLGTQCEPEDEVVELVPLTGRQLATLAAGSSSDRRTIGVAYELLEAGDSNAYFVPVRCR
jgi:hypothetical protein